MRSTLVVCAALAWASAGAGAQPPVCQDDVQCRTGYFCEAHYCRECFSCEELKREPAPDPEMCVTTPAKCGDCLKGLVYDSETDGCVAQTAQSPSPALPWQVWVAIAACLVLVALVAIVVFSLYRNPDTFKMTASARASVHHARSYAVNEASEASEASAPPPQPPPPYNLHYPPPPPPEPEPYLEESSPLVKRGLPEGRGGGGREAAAAQAAQVFNNPNYVHGPFYPHSSSAGADAESPTSPGSPGSALSDPPSPARSPEPLPLDEDTMESPWTPAPPAPATATPSAGGTGGAEGEPSASGAVALPMPAARRAHPAAGNLEPQAKMPRLSQDTNNNKNAEGRAGAAGGTSVTLNFNLNVGSTAVQQLNNVSL